MTEQTPFIFVDGLGFQDLSPNAPASVIGNVDINVEKFYAWCNEHKNEKGWAKITIRKSAKTGGLYATLNNFNAEMKAGERKKIEMTKELHGATPLNTPDTDEPENEDINPDDIPF